MRGLASPAGTSSERRPRLFKSIQFGLGEPIVSTPMAMGSASAGRCSEYAAFAEVSLADGGGSGRLWFSTALTCPRCSSELRRLEQPSRRSLEVPAGDASPRIDARVPNWREGVRRDQHQVQPEVHNGHHEDGQHWNVAPVFPRGRLQPRGRLKRRAARSSTSEEAAVAQAALTPNPRSRRGPTANRQARLQARSIILPPGLALSRRSRLTSNVRRHRRPQSPPSPSFICVRPSPKMRVAVAACVTCVLTVGRPHWKTAWPMLQDYAVVIRTDGLFWRRSVRSWFGAGSIRDERWFSHRQRRSVFRSGRVRVSARRCSGMPRHPARQAGYESIYLYTNEKMAENIALYAKVGYVEYERREEEGFRRVFMRKPLRTVTPNPVGRGEAQRQPRWPRGAAVHSASARPARLAVGLASPRTFYAGGTVLESGKAAFQLGQTAEHVRHGYAAGGNEQDPLAPCKFKLSARTLSVVAQAAPGDRPSSPSCQFWRSVILRVVAQLVVLALACVCRQPRVFPALGGVARRVLLLGPLATYPSSKRTHLVSPHRPRAAVRPARAWGLGRRAR